MKGQILHGREKEFGQQNHEGERKKIQSCMLKNRKFGRKNEKILLKNLSLKAAETLLFNPSAGATRQNPKEQGWRQQLLVLTQKFICTICYRNISQGEQGRHLRVSTQTEASAGKRNLSKRNSWCCQKEQSL